MTRKYQQPGDTMDWVNTTGGTVLSGAVVRAGNTLGVALTDIANNATGSVGIDGVFNGIPKVSSAVFTQGTKLLWDQSAGAFDAPSATPASGDVMGGAIAWVGGSNGQTTCTIKLTPGNTTLTP